MAYSSLSASYKHVASRMRVGLLWARLTSNWFIGVYFALAITTSIVLAVLQGIAYTDNRNAVAFTTGILNAANVNGFPIIDGDHLEICSLLPDGKTLCTQILPAGNSSVQGVRLLAGVNSTSLAQPVAVEGHSKLVPRGPSISPQLNGTTIEGVKVGDDVVLSMKCVTSIVWIHETLRDAKAEDLVILTFDIYIFSLSLLAVLTESIPHLFATVAAHVIATIWAIVRMKMANDWYSIYERFIVDGSCDGVDFLGNWWDVRAHHATPVVFINAAVMLLTAYLSINMYRIYSKSTFGRAGTSATVQRTYKLVLLFSAFLQVSGFFSLASCAIWIDKIKSGAVKPFVDTIQLYEGVFISLAILEVPWFISGWISVRRESRTLFILFAFLGAITLFVTPFMFASDIYRLVFLEWPFFAAITITAYIFVFVTFGIGIGCRLQFDKGLAHFLKVERELEDMDFTPAHMVKDPEKASDSRRSSLSKDLPFPVPAMTKHVRAIPSIDLPNNRLSMRTGEEGRRLSSRISALFSVHLARDRQSRAESITQVVIQSPSPRRASHISVGSTYSTDSNVTADAPVANGSPVTKDKTYILKGIPSVSKFSIHSKQSSIATVGSIAAAAQSRSTPLRPSLPATPAPPPERKRELPTPPTPEQAKRPGRQKTAFLTRPTAAAPPPSQPLPPVPSMLRQSNLPGL